VAIVKNVLREIKPGEMLPYGAVAKAINVALAAPEPLTPRQAEVIDVDSHPVEREPEPEPPAEEPEEPSEDLEACPECQSTEIDEDADGRYCRKCKATIEEYEPAANSEREESPDDELLRATEEAFREQFAGRLSIAAARLEALVDKFRGEL